jgi:peroxiredoxin
MVELGELEKHHEEFAQRHVQVVAISNDDQPTAQKTQADFPHLLVLSDSDQKMAKAFQVIHQGAAQDGSDTNAPTTFLVDGAGHVSWFFRPDRIITRLSPEQLVAAVDRAWPRK